MRALDPAAVRSDDREAIVETLANLLLEALESEARVERDVEQDADARVDREAEQEAEPHVDREAAERVAVTMIAAGCRALATPTSRGGYR